MSVDSRQKFDYSRYYLDVPEISSFPTNTLSMFKSHVRAHAHSPLIQYFDSTLTVEAVDSLSTSFALFLIDRGIKPKDRVALFLQNVPQYVIGFIGILKAGGIVVNVNPMSRELELERLLKDSGAKGLVCLEVLYDTVAKNISVPDIIFVVTTSPLDFLGPDTAKKYSKVLGDVTRIPPQSGNRSYLIVDFLDAIHKCPHRQLPPVDMGPNDAALLTYTSGTTGPSKGAINTHGNIVYNSEMLKYLMSFTTDDVFLIVAPLFHITGTVSMCSCLLLPMPMILTYRFEPQTASRLIKKYSASFIVGAITVYNAFLNEPTVTPDLLSSLRLIYSGGAPVPYGTIRQFKEKFNKLIHPIYGLTETTGPSHSVPANTEPPLDPKTGAVAVGIPLPGVESYIVDDSRKLELPDGEIGEIAIKGPPVVPSYWKKPEETQQTFNTDGTLYTGDMGIRRDGWFFVIDRKKDLIITSGYKVWPKEVEDLLQTIPGIHESSVLGVKDEYRGEEVVAFISLKSGVTLTEKDIIEECRKKLSTYKVPRRVFIVAELPKNASQKVAKFNIREQFKSKWEAKL